MRVCQPNPLGRPRRDLADDPSVRLAVRSWALSQCGSAVVSGIALLVFLPWVLAVAIGGTGGRTSLTAPGVRSLRTPPSRQMGKRVPDDWLPTADDPPSVWWQKLKNPNRLR